MADTSNTIPADQGALKERIEYLIKIISRYDVYLGHTNSKASLIIAWNGLVIGTLLLRYDELLRNFRNSGVTITVATLLLSGIGVCSVVSVFLVLNVVFPFLKSTSITNKEMFRPESAIFFGSVRKLTAPEYLMQISKLESNDLLADLADQAVILAGGLSSKMKGLRKSIVLLLIQLVFVFSLFILKVVAI